VNRWNELPSQFSGKDLITKQRELAYEALGKLAGGVELTQFLQFLKNKGAADLCQEIIDGGMVDLFRGEKGEAMRNWVLSVEDFALKEQLMIQAGMAYDGKDLAAFFERIGAYPNGHNSQCRFMTGYCSTMAKTDPLGAMKFYGEMCHPKKITNHGLEKVMEYVPPTADFLCIATEIKEDNAGLSKNTRRSLLNNWSQHKPAEAAQYVMSNTSVVHADQMAVVMKQWAQQDPDQAAAWIAGWDGSDHKDQGCLILAQTMKLAKPADAFVMASHISNFELKVKTATEAFNEWAKIDRKAAEAAWVQVFPQ
jgi:predicted house-cleaning NTP pyrophosphatase (Maf/HAM1 superfamily)